MGGGSSVMGMLPLRALPSDFDAWASADALGWQWRHVVEQFRQLEHDLDRKDTGAAVGPMPLRRSAGGGLGRAMGRPSREARGDPRPLSRW